MRIKLLTVVLLCLFLGSFMAVNLFHSADATLETHIAPVWRENFHENGDGSPSGGTNWYDAFEGLAYTQAPNDQLLFSDGTHAMSEYGSSLYVRHHNNSASVHHSGLVAYNNFLSHSINAKAYTLSFWFYARDYVYPANDQDVILLFNSPETYWWDEKGLSVGMTDSGGIETLSMVHRAIGNLTTFSLGLGEYDTSQWLWVNATVQWAANLASFAMTGVVKNETGSVLGSYATTYASNYVQTDLTGIALECDPTYEPNWSKYSSEMWYDELTVRSTGITVELSADWEDIDDAGADWAFTDWRYYTVQLTVPTTDADPLLEAALKFTVPTGATDKVETGYYADGVNSHWIYGSNITSATRFGYPTTLKDGSWTLSAVNTTIITFPIWFNDQVLDLWEDGVDVQCWLNFTTEEIDWFDAADNFFRIYSKGGFTQSFATSNPQYANLLAGGEWNQFYAYNGTLVTNSIWFRDLQHVKMLPVIYCLAGRDTWYLRIKVDYSVGEGQWLSGWMCMITPDLYSYTGIFASNVWANFTVNWFYGDVERTGYENRTGYGHLTSEDVYMFYHGSVSAAGQATRVSFWIDNWFNSINGSSTGGGRINAYEYPMKDNADLWLRWLANNWGVKDDVAKESMAMFDLRDADYNIMSSERIKMVRLTMELETYDNLDADGQLSMIENINVLDYTRSPDFPLTGVQTPVFDETKMPTVGNTGVLGAIFSMFSGIGQWLSENVIFGGLNLWGNFVAFLDTIAGWLGAPGFFSNLFQWIGDSIGYLASSIVYSLQVVWDFFSLFGALLGTFLTTIGQLIASLLSTLSLFVDLMGGVWGGAGNLWDTFQISNWLILAMIFYPLYLVYLWENEGMDAVVSQLSMIFGILVWLFNFFLLLGNSIIGLITGLIESIPVAE